MNRWIWPVTLENWKALLLNNLWSVDTEIKKKRVAKDDFIIFYVKGTGSFKGIFKIISDWYHADKPIWPDEIAESKIKTLYHCKLEPILIGDAVYNELIPSLSFVKNKDGLASYFYLQGNVVGPGNHGQPINENDYELIKNKMQEPVQYPEREQEKNTTEHQEVISKLLEIGSALGFESSNDDEDIYVAKGSKVDLVWKAKIANIGQIQYVFEVQSKGAIKSAIDNLMQAMNNQFVKKVIAVSDKKQLEQIKEHITQMKVIAEHSKSMFVYVDFNTIDKVYATLPALNDFKTLLQLS